MNTARISRDSPPPIDPAYVWLAPEPEDRKWCSPRIQEPLAKSSMLVGVSKFEYQSWVRVICDKDFRG